MFKITVNTLYILFLSLPLLSQTFKIDSTQTFGKKSLTFEEVNLVSSYYQQDGNHSAITGGEGTEKLTDFANVIDFKLAYHNGKGKKHSFGADVGIDYYTSASSDKIDTQVSSASSSDVRFYPSVNYSVENEKTGLVLGGNLAFSNEYDYISAGGGFHLSKSSTNRLTDFALRANIFFDTYRQIVPFEFRMNLPFEQRRKGEIGNAARNTFDLSMSISHIITKKLQAAITLDVDYQSGLLSTPFHRVYLKDGSLLREKLPDNRFKLPVGLRINYFIGEKIIVRSFYRYYQDNWGMHAHTAQIEIPCKLSPMYSISPFYRFHKQSAIDYFAPKGENDPGNLYYSSDFDLSGFNSHFYGMGIRYTPFKMIADIFAISQLEVRSGVFNRGDGMNAWIISLHLQCKGF